MLKGLQSELPAAAKRQDGAIYYCTDTKNAFLGLGENKDLAFFLSGVGRTYVDNSGNIRGEIFNDYSNNVASGVMSFASGSSTSATGECSVAEGYYTLAEHKYSHVAGQHTLSTGDCSFVIGKYNSVPTIGSLLFAVGNGSSDTNRTNAFSVDINGNVFVEHNLEADTLEVNYVEVKQQFDLLNSDNQSVISMYMDNTTPFMSIGTDGNTGDLLVTGNIDVYNTITTDCLEVNSNTLIKGVFDIQSTGQKKTHIVTTATSEENTIALPTKTGTVILNSTDEGVGSSSYPVYVTADNVIATCSQFANGTQVKLNNTVKNGVQATIYAPTAGGTKGHYLIGNGATAEPVWTTAIVVETAAPDSYVKGQLWLA